MKNSFTALFSLLCIFYAGNAFCWGSCVLNIQGPRKVCLDQTVNLFAARSGGDDLGDYRWSQTPGLSEGASSTEGCEATFTGTTAGDFWVTGYYERRVDYKCHDVDKITVAPESTGAACCDIRDVIITPTILLPRDDGLTVPDGPKQAEVLVSLWGPAPQGGCPIELKSTPIVRSGGHYHDTDDAPAGDLSSQSIIIPNGETEATAYFSSPFVSGSRSITVNVEGYPEYAIKKTVTVRVDGLRGLGASSGYRLTGQTTAHLLNHYGLSGTNSATAILANSYRTRKNATIGINDMSLDQGGLFDINGNWGTPHRSHRKGTSVDMDRCALVEGCPADAPDCDVSTITCTIPTIVNGRRTRDVTVIPGYRDFTVDEMNSACIAVGGFRVAEVTHHCEIR
jgi:hypothetical protein